METRDTEGASPFRAASESSRRKGASGEGARDDSCEYRLFACILHRGEGSNKGHYFAMCRVGPSNDDWCASDAGLGFQGLRQTAPAAGTCSVEMFARELSVCVSILGTVEMHLRQSGNGSCW